VKHALYGNRGRVINRVKNLQHALNKQYKEAEAREQAELQALWSYASGPNTLAGNVDL
jgi:hypothetical protein